MFGVVWRADGYDECDVPLGAFETREEADAFAATYAPVGYEGVNLVEVHELTTPDQIGSSAKWWMTMERSADGPISITCYPILPFSDERHLSFGPGDQEWTSDRPEFWHAEIYAPSMTAAADRFRDLFGIDFGETEEE